VVLGRERDFAEELKAFWWSAASRSPVHTSRMRRFSDSEDADC
jgi:hypothetical protein